MATCNLGLAFDRRAMRALDVPDLDRAVASWQLALPRFREAARIYRTINHVDDANLALASIVKVEKKLRLAEIKRAAVAAAAAAAASEV